MAVRLGGGAVARSLWAAATGLGLTLLPLAALVFAAYPADAHDVPAGYGAPIYALEFARSAEDVEAVLGPPGDPERAARVEAMRLGTSADHPFLVAYALFMTVFLLGAADAWGWLRWAAPVGLVAGLADAVENGLLLLLVDDLEGLTGLAALPWPVTTKFVAIALGNAAASAFIASRPGWRIGGVISGLAVTTIPLALAAPASYGWLVGLGVTVSWLVMLTYAGWAWRTGRSASKSAASAQSASR